MIGRVSSVGFRWVNARMTSRRIERFSGRIGEWLEAAVSAACRAKPIKPAAAGGRADRYRGGARWRHRSSRRPDARITRFPPARSRPDNARDRQKVEHVASGQRRQGTAVLRRASQATLDPPRSTRKPASVWSFTSCSAARVRAGRDPSTDRRVIRARRLAVRGKHDPGEQFVIKRSVAAVLVPRFRALSAATRRLHEPHRSPASILEHVDARRKALGPRHRCYGTKNSGSQWTTEEPRGPETACPGLGAARWERRERAGAESRRPSARDTPCCRMDRHPTSTPRISCKESHMPVR